MSNASLIDYAKAQAAKRAVAENFDPHSRYVGIGSGTTIVFVVNAIRDILTNPEIQFVGTGAQSLSVIQGAGLKPLAYEDLPDDAMLDVAFDGCDECDTELNLIKGGGACLFQEKLVVERANKWVCVADYRKQQTNLLKGIEWKGGIPIEVAPIAAKSVVKQLCKLGATSAVVRTRSDGSSLPTDQGFHLIDAQFPSLRTSSDPPAPASWEPQSLSRAIKAITGVLEVGLFTGEDGPARIVREGMGGQKPISVYFGMSDGGVQVRTIEGTK